MAETVEYPMNSFFESYYNGLHEPEWIQQVADMGDNQKWNELIEFLKKDEYMYLVNTSRLHSKNEPPPSLFTPLHYAAVAKAPKEVFVALLELGASKCLKTTDGETAYDIGKRQGLDSSILEIIKNPEEVKQNENQIKAMETALHDVIKERVVDLINKHGLQLPQLSVLFEIFKNKVFFYDVIGWHGGFRVYEHEKGIQSDSYCRVWGGSERNHLIEHDGTITLLPNDDPM